MGTPVMPLGSSRLSLGDVCELVSDADLQVLAPGAENSPTLRAWLTASMFHASYRAEVPGLVEAGLHGLIHDALREIGEYARDVLAIGELLRYKPDAQAGEMSLFLASTPAMYTEIVAALGLEARARLGKGEKAAADAKGEYSLRLLSGVADQLLGALVMVGEWEAARSHVVGAIRAAGVVEGGRDPKTALQELPGASPSYELVWARGPDHAKEFCWRVTAFGGAHAMGEGHSKKEAQGRAAARILREHWKTPTAPLTTGESNWFYAPASDLPDSHKRTVLALARQFLFEKSDVVRLSQALIHTSWIHEHRRGTWTPRHYQPLVRIGAAALGLAYWFEVASRLAANPNRAERRPTGSFLSLDNLNELATDLALEGAIALGRGQASVGLTPSVLADAAQAVVGAVVLVFGPERFLWEPPEQIEAWVNVRADAAVDGSRAGDHRTELQETLVVLGLSHRFETDGSGPDHARRFRARLMIVDDERSVVVRGPEARSKRGAEQAVSGSALRALRAIHGSLESHLNEMAQQDPLVAQLIRMSFGALLHRSPVMSAETLLRHSLLNIRALAQGNIDDFCRWTAAIDRLNPTLPWNNAAAQVFQNAALSGARRSGAPIFSLLSNVVAGVRAISLDEVRHLTSRPWFDDLLDAAIIARLAARAPRLTTVADLLDGWNLLHGRDDISVEVVSPADGAILEPEGGVHALLSEMVRCCKAGQGTIQVFVDDDRLRMVVRSLSALIPLKRRWETAQLWWYLKSSLAIRPLELEGDRAVVSIALSSKRRFGDHAVSAFGQEALSIVPSPVDLASQLHDMKNHLIAAVAADQAPTDSRTGRLSLQHQVSQHLDSAEDLARRIGELARSVTTIDLRRIDMFAFFRQYISEKLRSLPPGIQIVPPGADRPFVLTTSPLLLRSIVENLVKNAVEAMPQGGRVRLDWIGDENEGSVVLEIRDSGCGLPAAMAEAVKSYGPLQSSKAGGSGIGIWSTLDSCRRLGISVSLQTGAEGTAWTLLIPDLAVITEPREQDPKMASTGSSAL